MKLAIIGTTASGKTALALEVAKRLNGVILSLDSLCIYKEIDIASAKPTAEELNAVRHFGIDLVSPDEHFCVGDFVREFRAAQEFCHATSRPLIIVGGSGFYLAALMHGLSPRVPPLNAFLDREKLWRKICEVDPPFAAAYSKNDTFRLQKWLEIYKFTNEQPSVWLKANLAEPVLKSLPIFELDWQKSELEKRIFKRTEMMFESGLLDEARGLFERYGFEAKPLNSIGLKECGEFLRGRVASEKELCELVCIHTRQLAKRQRTFNKKAFSESVKMVNFDIEESCERIVNFAKIRLP